MRHHVSGTGAARLTEGAKVHEARIPIALIGLVALIGLACSNASAGTMRAEIPVSAIVVNNCVARVPTSIEFPTYAGSLVQSTGALQLKCTKRATPIVAISSVTNVAADGQRRMTGPDGHYLNYQIYSASDYRAVWSAVTEAPADGVTSTTYTLYCAIPSGQSAPKGTYVDSLDLAIDPGTGIAEHYTVRITTDVP
jgi:spore coat protein U-like protein